MTHEVCECQSDEMLKEQIINTLVEMAQTTTGPCTRVDMVRMGVITMVLVDAMPIEQSASVLQATQDFHAAHWQEILREVLLRTEASNGNLN